MSVKDIIKGHYNELIGKGTDISAARMEVCKKCPLFKLTLFGPICNSDLYLNPLTNETSVTPKEGFNKGCACRLNAKTRLNDVKCPNGKW